MSWKFMVNLASKIRNESDVLSITIDDALTLFGINKLLPLGFGFLTIGLGGRGAAGPSRAVCIFATFAGHSAISPGSASSWVRF